MTFFEIQSHIEVIEKNTSLYAEKNFDLRTKALDWIEFDIIGEIENLLHKEIEKDQLIPLKYRVERLKSALEEVDSNLFQKIQDKIRTKAFTGQQFKNLVREYVDFDVNDNKHQEEPGYDNLDVFINGLFPDQTMPEQTKDMEPEMVYYQKTPVRVVFELVEKSSFSKGDVFFDLGSGLGQVAILVNLLGGIPAKGIEFEPAFCKYAIDCASALNLPDVSFKNVDARKADYSTGTVFFMFTPFSGQILQDVLELLRKESLQRKIKVITYGPVTAQVALQSWLDRASPKSDHIYKLAVFNGF